MRAVRIESDIVSCKKPLRKLKNRGVIERLEDLSEQTSKLSFDNVNTLLENGEIWDDYRWQCYKVHSALPEAPRSKV